MLQKTHLGLLETPSQSYDSFSLSHVQRLGVVFVGPKHVIYSREVTHWGVTRADTEAFKGWDIGLPGIRVVVTDGSGLDGGT